MSYAQDTKGWQLEKMPADLETDYALSALPLSLTTVYGACQQYCTFCHWRAYTSNQIGSLRENNNHPKRDYLIDQCLLFIGRSGLSEVPGGRSEQQQTDRRVLLQMSNGYFILAAAKREQSFDKRFGHQPLGSS